jgi:signal transduction histidine kinase
MSTAAKLIQDKANLLPANGPVPNRRILVVDDEPAIADGIRNILCPADTKVTLSSRSSRSAGKAAEPVIKKDEFDVVVVNNPKDALTAIRDSITQQRPFAVGFFDVMLGAEMDGIELVKQALLMDSRIFAVFVTAYHDRNVDSIGAYLGEENREKWDYINKPFTDGEILQKARNATSLWDLQRLKDWHTERLSEAHQLLLQTERINAAAAVGRSVVHEFGNLLTHIIGHAEIALDGNDMQIMRNAFDVILKASDTATSVLRRFRRLNDTTDPHVEFKITDLKTNVEEALEIMEFRFRRHSVAVDKTDLKSVQISASRNSLIQVLVNLFINAMHAMPEGGALKISLSQEDKYAVLKVKDSGTGIPPEILPKVTEPMFTTKGKEGSGLGLAICKEIIEIEHQGEFKIDNHPAGGVEVTLRLPLSQEQDHE